MVGVDSVAQAEAPGEQGGSQQQRPVVERQQRPHPGHDVGRDEQAEQAGEPGAKVAHAAMYAQFI